MVDRHPHSAEGSAIRDLPVTEALLSGITGNGSSTDVSVWLSEAIVTGNAAFIRAISSACVIRAYKRQHPLKANM